MKAFDLFSIILKYGIDTKLDPSVLIPVKYKKDETGNNILNGFWTSEYGELKEGHEYISVTSYPDGSQRFNKDPDVVLSNKTLDTKLHLYEIE